MEYVLYIYIYIYLKFLLYLSVAKIQGRMVRFLLIIVKFPPLKISGREITVHGKQSLSIMKIMNVETENSEFHQ